jgi:hypothetical protein
MPISKEQVQQAIVRFGAVQVHDAAIKKMGGDASLFDQMGFVPLNLGDVYRVLTIAYEEMGEASRAISYAKTQAELNDFEKKS